MMFSKFPICFGALLFSTFSAGLCTAPAAEPLTAGQAFQVSKTSGKCDFLALDGDRRRLLVSHTGNGSLDVIDIDKSSLVKSVSTGAAQDCAVDQKGGRYFVSVSKPPQVAVVDADKLIVTGSIPLSGPADLLTYDAEAKRAYVCHDDGTELWLVDPAAMKIAGTIALPSDAPEDLCIDTKRKHLVQAMKSASTMAVFDLASGKQVANWPTAPAQSPHGIALVPEADAVAVSGGNGKLVLIDLEDGKILSSSDMPQRVDQIAYDRDWHRVYCASGTGVIGVYSIEDKQLKKLGETASSAGARSVAVDPKTHTVWLAYVKGGGFFVQPFTGTR